MPDDRENMWRCINALQTSDATTKQMLADMAKNVDRLVDEVRENLARDQDARREQAVQIAQVEKDAKAATDSAERAHLRLTDHKDGHRWFAGTIIAAAGVIVVLIQIFWK